MNLTMGNGLRGLRIIWSSQPDGSLRMGWTEEGLETASAGVLSFLKNRPIMKGGYHGR
jgi:hypothetical protein